MDITEFLSESSPNVSDDRSPQHFPKSGDSRISTSDFDPASLGPEIRRLRKERGWKLQDLAARSGVSMSTLSRVETGRMSLTVDRAHSLIEALGLNFSKFLTDVNAVPQPGAAGWRSVSRANEGRVVTTHNGVYRYLCSDVQNRRMINLIASPTARTLEEHGPLVSHPGEEFEHVLHGSVVLITSLYEPLELMTGDSILFDARIPHAVLRSSDEEPRVLATIVDPFYA